MNGNIIKNRVIGVDISLERTSYAIVDVRGNIIARDCFNTQLYDNANDYIRELSVKVVELAEANGGFENIRSMGISAPSGNSLTGCIENAPNLKWKGVIPMAAMLRDRLGIAVGLGNDAQLSGLGEHAFGSAHGMNNFILVTLGHGIGSCIFCNGEVHHGADGFAGEVGHTCIVYGGRTCACGKKGCLEAYCGAKGIIATANELMAESDEPSLMRTIDRLTPKKITECCDQGDHLAVEVYQRTGQMLGVAMAGYATLLDPEAIVFAGGVSKADHWLLEPAYEQFNKLVFHNIRGHVKFLVSALEDHERDVLGASALAWGIKEYSLFK